MTISKLHLYVKTGCPWCRRAEEYLREHGYTYDRVDVLEDRAAYAELKKISGQTYTPTLQVGEHILADFGPEELAAFLQQHNIQPE